MKHALLLLAMATVASLTLPAWALAQTQGAHPTMPRELGKPFLTTWQQKDYALAGNQNGAIVPDDRGVMYFGNSSGILEYDGVSWRLIELPNKTVCRSLAIFP